VYKRLQRLKELDEIDFEDVAGSGMTKKELLHLRRERDKLDRSLGGIKDMARTPSALWVVDTKKEHIAVSEARKLGIPVIAILDTNCDPDEVTYPIPGNDDAIRSVSLLTRVVADAVADGLIARAGAANGEDKPAAAAGSGELGAEEPLAEWERELLEHKDSAAQEAGPATEARAGEAPAPEARAGEAPAPEARAGEAPAPEARAGEAPAPEADGPAPEAGAAAPEVSGAASEAGAAAPEVSGAASEAGAAAPEVSGAASEAGAAAPEADSAASEAGGAAPEAVAGETAPGAAPEATTGGPVATAGSGENGSGETGSGETGSSEAGDDAAETAAGGTPEA
jgi:Ribosomal protein S2